MKRQISERQAILREFQQGSSVRDSLRKHSSVEAISGRIGNKRVVVFDRQYKPECLEVEKRDRLSMYYDKFTKEAQGVIYEDIE